MDDRLRARIFDAIEPHTETISGTEARDATKAVLTVFREWLLHEGLVIAADVLAEEVSRG